jgi:hypothetical protein
MIIYDLRCNNGHEFEGWFKDYQDFEDQKEQKLLCCPMCDDTKVDKILSTLSVVSSKEERRKELEARKKLADAVYDFVDKNFEDVGPDFAKTAIDMHYGFDEKRNIRGTTTPNEEKALEDEGVEFIKIPLPPRPDDTELH